MLKGVLVIDSKHSKGINVPVLLRIYNSRYVDIYNDNYVDGIIKFTILSFNSDRTIKLKMSEMLTCTCTCLSY